MRQALMLLANDGLVVFLAEGKIMVRRLAPSYGHTLDLKLIRKKKTR